MKIALSSTVARATMVVGVLLFTPATIYASGNIPQPIVTTDDRSSDGTITVETGEWKLVFDEHFNGGISQWYDLAFDPGQTDNLATESGGGTYSQGVLFDYDVYLGVGFSDGQEFMTTMGRNSDPGSLELSIVENTPARVRVLQRGHPRLNNGSGPPGDPFPELKWIRTTTLWTLYPTGKLAIDFSAEVNPDGVAVDSGPGGSGKGVDAPGCCGFEQWLNASGGANFLEPFVWAGDTIESSSGGWGPISIVQRFSPTQLVLAEPVPAGTNLDYIIRRDQMRLETVSIHADGDPTIVAQCSDPAISRWQGGSNGDPLWSILPPNDACRTRFRDNSAATGFPPIADDVILAHWTRDRGAGSGLVFYEPWQGVNGGFFNDEAFTDISYTQLGKVGNRQFSPHHSHFMVQLGSSWSTVLPTIKSVSDMIPMGEDYRFPYVNVIVGERVWGGEIAGEGFNPGQGAYEIKALCNQVLVRFVPCGTGQNRACLPYVAPVFLIRNFDSEDEDVTVDISTDAGTNFVPLDTSRYNLTGRFDEVEIGLSRRIFQYLDTVPATATGDSRVVIRIATASGICPVTTTSTTTTTTSTSTTTTTTVASVCGNGLLESGEDCDDGNIASGDGCSSDCGTESAQTRAQQKCINGLNKAAWKLARAQGRANAGCVRDAGNGTEPDPGNCIVSDAGEKIAKSRSNVTRAEQRGCDEPPDFGFTGAQSVNVAVVAEEIGMLGDVFGADLNTALLGGGPVRASCQAAVAKDSDKILSALLKTFVRCKKAGLRGGEIDSGAALEGCFDEVAADPRGKVARAAARMAGRMAAKCDTNLMPAFPGRCSDTLGASEFTQCIGDLADCRACRMLNAADGMNRNCDAFDDGELNTSCQ